MAHSNPEISVILPVYNASAYVEEAVQSILDQTFGNFELLLINDGSTDDSEQKCLRFNDARVVYIRNETNIGLIATLNKGLAMAKGQYIARMDADDVSLPQRFEKQIQLFKQYPDAVVVSCDHFGWDGKQALTRVYTETGSDELKAMLLFATCFCHPVVMIRNVFSNGTIQYNASSQHVEDYRLWMDLSFLGSFHNVPEPLLKYRSHAQQVSVLHRETQLKNSNTLRKQFLEKLGFCFSEKQLQVHNSIGNNVFITSSQQLNEIEAWLLQLKQQNLSVKWMKEEAFRKVLHKFWIDSCGYSNLGLKAYNNYLKSDLRVGQSLRLSGHFKLIAKCFIRRFRKQ